MEYKLSICMMVKNEELHLERCLNSIKSIVARDDVELIIVDTGSKDRTVDIAKGYTDRVYYKEWFNDFSEMRNITISYAKGEWIFIIDADETVENVDKFIDFLNSKKIYDTYFVSEKNYTNIKNLDSYSLIKTPRFFKNDGKFRYDGVVHNQPQYRLPAGYLDIVLGHYGYIVSDKKIMDEKFNRTTSLLKNELKKKPNDIYYLFQLATSYNMHGDIDDSYKISKKALELLLKHKNQQISGFSILSIHLPNCLVLEKYNEAIETANLALNLRPDYVDGYFYLLFSYEKLGNLDIAKKYSEKFIELVERFNDLEISKDDSIAIYRTDKATVNKVKSFLVQYHINRNELKDALKYLNEKSIDMNNINLYIDIYIKTNNFQKLKDLYYEINDQDLKYTLFEKIEEKIINFKLDKKNKIRSLFVDVSEDYSKFCLFSTDITINNEKKLEIYKNILLTMRENTPNIYYAEILSFILEHSNFNLVLFNKFDKSTIFYFLEYFYNHKYLVTYSKILEWLKIKDKNELLLKNEVTLKNLLEGILLRVVSEYKNTGIDTQIKDNISIFQKYIDVGISVISKIYITQGMSLKHEFVNDYEAKFLILMNLYYENLYNSNTKSALKYYKLAVETYPEMADFMGQLLTSEFENR